MLIGSLQWTAMLCRYNIAYATNNLARYSVAPREGHLKAALHVVGYLKHYAKGIILMDPQDFEMPECIMIPEIADWCQMYPNATEDIPPNTPEPLMKDIALTMFVDTDHASDVVTRRSVTGILMFFQNVPFMYYSKNQKTVKSSA